MPGSIIGFTMVLSLAKIGITVAQFPVFDSCKSVRASKTMEVIPVAGLGEAPISSIHRACDPNDVMGEKMIATLWKRLTLRTGKFTFLAVIGKQTLKFGHFHKQTVNVSHMLRCRCSTWLGRERKREEEKQGERETNKKKKRKRERERENQKM